MFRKTILLLSIFIIDQQFIAAQTDSLKGKNRFGIYADAGTSIASGGLSWDGGIYYSRSQFIAEVNYSYFGIDRHKLPNIDFNEFLVRQKSYSVLAGFNEMADRLGVSIICGFGFGRGRFHTVSGSYQWNLNNINVWQNEDFKIFILKMNAHFELIKNVDLCAGFIFSDDFIGIRINSYSTVESNYLIHDFGFQIGLRYEFISI
jgi:hypothetical protein